MNKSTFEVDEKNILGQEIIGLRVEVKKSSDENKQGIKGVIKEETKNTITVETIKGLKKIPKKEVTLKFIIGKKIIEVEGKLLECKPEARTKQWWRKYYGRM
ncbi:MAG: ribonuclease P protein subunit [archaeon]